MSARYVEVRAYLVRGDRVDPSPLAVAAGPDYFVSESQPKRTVRLRIGEARRFQYGDTVRIVACDADAPDDELDRVDATLNVEPEL